jgi:5'-nucleotidase
MIGLKNTGYPAVLELRIILASISITILLAASSVLGTEHSITFAFTTNFNSQSTPMEDDSGSTGGAARLSKAVRDLRLREDRFILLDTGDHFAGANYAAFDGAPGVESMNRMRYDAMLLGKEELAMGEERLDNIGRLARFPIVLSNIIAPPQCKTCRHVVQYTTTERSGIIVGVFGILPSKLAREGRVIDQIELEEDLYTTARQTVEILGEKCDIIVMLSQLDMEDNIMLAEGICDIDLIISSKSENCFGDPIEVTGEDGCNTPIFRTCGRGAMLGVILTKWNDIGIMTSYSWQPIAIDESISPDPEIYEIVAGYMDSLAPPETLETIETELDARYVILNSGESNAGNLVCDAIFKAYPDADMAILPAGTFFGDRIIPPGPLTDRDIRDMIPYGDRAVVVKISGAVLKKTLERAAFFLGGRFGGFLQIAGARVIIDKSKGIQTIEDDGTGIIKKGNAVREFRVGLEKIESDREYTVVTSDFLARGGFGYPWMSDVRSERGRPIDDIVIDYLRGDGAKVPPFEDRILIIP